MLGLATPNPRTKGTELGVRKFELGLVGLVSSAKMSNLTSEVNFCKNVAIKSLPLSDPKKSKN